MIDEAQAAEIRRLFFGEHWKVGTIADMLGVHRDVVERVIDPDSFTAKTKPRPSALDPYVPFMRDTLARFPRLTGSRLHRMLQERGYTGSVVQVRRRIRSEGMRDTIRKEAFFELTVLPGEQGQVDWMHLGSLPVEGGERKVSALVIVLSHSRATWAHFAFDQKVESVLRGHLEAFEHFGGVPRNLLYDNMKTAVVERERDAIRFHPRLVELSAHYLFSAVPCGPYRPHEKGRVERRIRDIRESFLAGSAFRTLDELRIGFRRWQQDVLYERPHPDDRSRTVREVFEAERGSLLPLPQNPLETDEVRAITVPKQPYIHYDSNRYSVPADLVRSSVTLSVGGDRVRVLDGQDELASHPRCYGKHQRIDDPEHLDELAANKRKAAASRGRKRVHELFGAADLWYEHLARRRMPLGPQTAKLLRLVDEYSHDVLLEALTEAIERGTPSADSIAYLARKEAVELEKQGLARIATPVVVPKEVRDIDVRQHNLGDYDGL